MPATDSAEKRGSSATVRLREDVFLDLTGRMGANGDTARGELLGLDRGTVLRLRTGQFLPNLSNAIRIADILGTTVEDLFEQVAA